MRTFDNLGRRWFRSAHLLLVPVAIVGLGTMGVVAPPTLSLSEARSRLGSLEAETNRLESVAVQMAELESAGLPARVRAARAGLESIVPDSMSGLELHALVRASGEAVGARLETLVVGDWEDPGFDRLGDYIGVRRVTVHGTGVPHHLVGLIEALRGMGLPVATIEFQINKQEGSEKYTFQLSFDVFERTDPPPLEVFEEEAAAASDGETN